MAKLPSSGPQGTPMKSITQTSRWIARLMTDQMKKGKCSSCRDVSAGGQRGLWVFANKENAIIRSYLTAADKRG